MLRGSIELFILGTLGLCGSTDRSLRAWDLREPSGELSEMALGSKEFKLQRISRMCEALWHILATLLLLSRLRMVSCVPHRFYAVFRECYECCFWA